MWEALKSKWKSANGNPTDLLNNARRQEQRGNLTKAEEYCRRVLRNAADDPAAIHLLGQILARKGEVGEAEALLRQAIVLQRLKPQGADAHMQLGWLLFQHGRRDEGMHCLRQAVALDPGSAEAHLQLGIALAMLDDPQEAAKSFRHVLKIRPEHVDACNNLGVALFAGGQFDEAADCLSKALQFNPDNPKTRAVLGDVYARQSRFADAVVQYLKAIVLRPDHAQTRFALAAALAADGQLAKAVVQYREAIRQRPDYAEAYCNLGLLLNELGQEDAGDFMRRARELAPHNREIAINLRLQGSGAAPMWHFSMMNDAPRNVTYDAAIRRALRPLDRVLDIGTGSGLLSMMAARAGATSITSCEMVPAIAAKARQIIEHNGYAGQINVVAERSTDLRVPSDMPEAADLLISEIFATDLLGEEVLSCLEHAKEHLLKPDARIIPAQAWIVGQLAGADELAHYLRVTTVAGFNLQAFNEFSPVTVTPAEWNIELESFSEPFEIFDFDFQGRRHFPSAKSILSIPVTRSGLCYGVLQWIRLRLYDDIMYENSASATSRVGRTGHWRHFLHTFETPLMLQQGQLVNLHASHNRKNLLFFIE